MSAPRRRSVPAGGTSKISRMTVTASGNRVDVRGIAPVGTGPVDLTVDGRLERPAALASWLPAHWRPTGSLVLSGRLVGSRSDPYFAARISGSGLESNGIVTDALGPLTFSASGRDRNVDFDLGLETQRGDITGTIGLEQGWPFEAHANLRGSPLAPLVALLKMAAPFSDTTGTVTASADVAGRLDRPLDSSVVLTLSQLDGQSGGKPLKLVQPGRVRFDARRPVVEQSLRMTVGGFSIGLASGDDRDGGGVVTTLEGRIEDGLAFLPADAANAQWRAEGPVRARIAMARVGHGSALSGDADATLDRVVRSGQELARDVRLRARIRGGAIEISDAAGYGTRGTIHRNSARTYRLGASFVACGHRHGCIGHAARRGHPLGASGRGAHRGTSGTRRHQSRRVGLGQGRHRGARAGSTPGQRRRDARHGSRGAHVQQSQCGAGAADGAAVQPWAAGNQRPCLERPALDAHRLGRYRASSSRRWRTSGRGPSGPGVAARGHCARRCRRRGLPGSCRGTTRIAPDIGERRVERRQHHRAELAAGTRRIVRNADARSDVLEARDLRGQLNGGDLTIDGAIAVRAGVGDTASSEDRRARAVRRDSQGAAQPARHEPHVGEPSLRGPRLSGQITIASDSYRATDHGGRPARASLSGVSPSGAGPLPPWIAATALDIRLNSVGPHRRRSERAQGRAGARRAAHGHGRPPGARRPGDDPGRRTDSRGRTLVPPDGESARIFAALGTSATPEPDGRDTRQLVPGDPADDRARQ